MLDVTHAPAPTAFPIVGVGASAGGLEAFTQLLQRLPPNAGFALVLIQHLDRSHPSLLREALAKVTTLPVHQAEHGMRVESGQVYVIAPNTDLAIVAGQLVVSPRGPEGVRSHLPVDYFLRSLAEELGNRAIGVILSGSASDGTDGLRTIRAHDGITFAQDPRSAKFAGMPQSAIDAGVVDYCLGIPQLADELIRLSHHSYVEARAAEPDAAEAGVREQIFARVRSAIGVDFSEFKPATAARRLARRLALRKVADLNAYLALLETEPEEIRALYEDMLIHVTSFFRDPEMFTALCTHVFPEILKYKPERAPVRIWVAGCATGEEVYSIAIAFLEFSDASNAGHPLQIFGSDVSDVAIQKARAGIYSESALRDVSAERLARYFSKVDGGQRIDQRVRDACVFMRHDLVSDPPLSKVDLISCRNVLIYFDQALQKRVLPMLHYSLNQPGFLVLGRNENIAGFSQLFSSADKASNIFRRMAGPSNLRFAPAAMTYRRGARLPERGRAAFPEQSATFAKHLDRLLLARYCPAGVLVNENMDVLLFRGQTGSYLQAAPGQPQNNLIGMARGGLVEALRAAIAQAKQDMSVVRRSGVEVDQDGSTKTCDVVVLPFTGPPNCPEGSLFVVLFEEPGRTGQQAVPELVVDAAPTSAQRQRTARLEHELASIKEYLYTLIEEHGRANDELGTSNEELVSGNEELQSMNEELETAKEELQSVNQELSTLNDELRSRNDEVTQVNSDLLNLALTADIAMLTLDMQRRIRRFTPKAHSVFHLRPVDVGRSIDEIRLKIDVRDLGAQIGEVLASGSVNESEVKDENGHWYRMQIRPYKMAERIDGAIVSLVDIDHLKRLVAEAEAARIEAERANRAKDDFLAMLSHELRTPLSSMLLNAQVLRSAAPVDRARLERVGEALERATSIQAKLIDDLLDVSRIAAGKFTLDCRPVDLRAAVRETIAASHMQIDAKGLELRLSLESAIRPIWADAVRVQQVISNLLGNAIKFTPKGGRVTIVVDALADFGRLRIDDTGIGIEPDFLPQVFSRFSQSDSSTTRKYGGLGLGLSIVRQLVDLHGGTAQAQSAGPGQGASFTVTFPLARASDRVGLSSPPKAASNPHALDRPGRMRQYQGLNDLRVLFIDDDRSTREAILEVLQLAGARVELAASAAEGVTAIERFKPRVIVCDIAMPGENGYEFMRKLRAREAGAGAAIPALALTALASLDDRHTALAAGFQLHMAKPIDIDRLRDAVLELSRLSLADAPPEQS